MPGGMPWDEIKNVVQDKQRAGTTPVKYAHGCYWVEECLVHDDNGVVMGKLTTRTLISNAQAPHELDYVKMGTTPTTPVEADSTC